MAKDSLEYAKKMSKEWNKEIEHKVLSDPQASKIYERKHREIEVALLMRQAREKAHLSQVDIAERMNTTRSAVSRLESSGTGRHSPSLNTLLKYAQALGYSIKIKLVTEKNINK